MFFILDSLTRNKTLYYLLHVFTDGVQLLVESIKFVEKFFHDF